MSFPWDSCFSTKIRSISAGCVPETWERTLRILLTLSSSWGINKVRSSIRAGASRLSKFSSWRSSGSSRSSLSLSSSRSVSSLSSLKVKVKKRRWLWELLISLNLTMNYTNILSKTDLSMTSTGKIEFSDDSSSSLSISLDIEQSR